MPGDGMYVVVSRLWQTSKENLLQDFDRQAVRGKVVVHGRHMKKREMGGMSRARQSICCVLAGGTFANIV